MKKFILLTLLLATVMNFCACAELFDTDVLNPNENNGNTVTLCEHIPTTVSEIAPSCTKDGQSAYEVCSLCGEILSEPTILQMLDHSFDPKLSPCSERQCLTCDKIIPESHEYELKKLDINGSEEIERYGLFACKNCNASKEESVNFNNAGIGVLCLSGSMDGISKENKVLLDATYYGDGVTAVSPATLKWQGASSLSYDKKNFNIQFVDAETGKGNKLAICDKWGEQSKYTLKANYVDFTQARNVCSGKIYGKIVHTRRIDDEFDALVNGGAIDGFPILIYINGTYQGLYTMNIPKDKWLFDMDKTGKQAIVMAEHWGDSVSLKQHMSYDFASTCWELEFCSTEDDPEIGTAWVVDSFNEMMDFVNNNNGKAFKDGIRKYINVERAIDSMLYTWFIRGEDNTAKNILWVTYDGVQWTPSVYDMDDSWGLVYHGQSYYSPTGMMPNQTLGRNMLWDKLYENFFDEISARYAELRKKVLTHSKIMATFKSFIDSIPSAVYYYEGQKWPDMPSQDTNNIYRISDWVEQRLIAYDQFFNYVP